MVDLTGRSNLSDAETSMFLRLIDARFAEHAAVARGNQETMNAKLDGLKASIDAMNALYKRFDDRIDDHEGRLQTVEQTLESRKVVLREYEDVKDRVQANEDAIAELKLWQKGEVTTSANAKSWGGMVWAVGGSAISGIIYWIITAYVSSLHPAPAPDMSHTKTTIEQTSTAPAPGR